jgi:NAD(P)-dependent dehydrogenase (short-subunit alcohol dehydrogenase family)
MTTGMFDLNGRVAIVTGGASGLGAAIVRGLCEFGASVAVCDIAIDGARQIANAMEDLGAVAWAYDLDIREPESVEACVDKIAENAGPIRVLVNSAGIVARRPATEMDVRDWQRVIDVNLSGSWYCTQTVGRRMVSQRTGSIVTIGSVVGQVGIDTGNVNYAASKAGLIGMTKCLAVEWAAYNVRVNLVAPTHFRTPLVSLAIRDNVATEQHFVNNIPLGRLGEPEEIVGAVVYLASDAASMVTGHVLNVDGGHTAR